MLWVVIPALNEAENLRVVVPQILAVLPEVDPASRLLVVDDGSTDDTAKVMDELMREHPSVEVLTHRHNLGKAAALQNAVRPAVEGQADVVVMMDADGQDDPAELPALVARLRDGADLVTGARIVRRDRFVKRTTSRLYNRTTAVMSGAPGRDFNSGYKVMRAARGRATCRRCCTERCTATSP